MHGAQDGQKFIGVIIAFEILLKSKATSKILPRNFIWEIILVSIVMLVGVATGGKRIVENLGENISYLENEDALISDFSTILILLFSSLNGIPISTSHVKTISIVSSVDGRKKVNFKNVIDIFKAWIYTFPICIFIAFFTMKILMNIL